MKQLRVFSALVTASLASVLGLFLVVIMFPMAMAQAQSVAQSYVADAPLQAGMIVKLANDKTKVAPVAQKDGDSIYGVVVRPNDAPLSLSEGETGQKVYVATNDSYQVLVSDQNGSIAQGDYVVLSAIEGIGMKVDNQAGYVVGKALQSFNNSSEVLSKTTVKDTAGHERTVKISMISVEINIARNPLHKGVDSPVPELLQKVADSIAGRPVSAIRVYVGLITAIVSAGVASSVLYAGVRASMIAMGRNPLARQSILRNLIQIILVGLTILVIGLFAVYLLLKL